MKKAVIVAIAAVAVIAFVGVFAGAGTNKQAGVGASYQRMLEEDMASKSTTPSEPSNENNCDPAYPDFCIPSYYPDVDCSQIQERNFKVLPPDPHGFDPDKNGIGCES